MVLSAGTGRLARIGPGATLALLGLCLFAAAGAARAADPTTDLAAGGLTYAGPPDLVTESEDIVVAADQVRATYVVHNSAAEARVALLAFALPDIDMLALDGAAVDAATFDPNNPANFVAFGVIVDGQPVETFVEIRALALGLLDNTTRLRDLGLPLYPFTPDLGDRLAALPEAARDDLMAWGLIRFNDGQWEPLWRLRTTVFWRQPFEINQTHTLTLSYRPIAGTGGWTTEQAAALQQRFCVPPAVADSLAKRGDGAREPAKLSFVTYASQAGAIGRGSVAKYRIAIETGGPSRTAYTCAEGLAAGDSPGNREKTRANFTPDDELSVLFVE